MHLHTLMHENLRIPPKVFLNVLVPFSLLVNPQFWNKFYSCFGSIGLGLNISVLFLVNRTRYWNKFKSAKDAASTQRVGYRLSSETRIPCTRRNPQKITLRGSYAL